MPVYIDGYPMDLAVSETHGFTSEVAEHPVERGADITDHVRARPITIDMECIVSDTPLAKIANDLTRQGSTLPSEDAYAHLLAIRDARQPVTIETSLGTFSSMAMLSLSVPRDAGKSGGLFFTVSFQQIRVIENKRVTTRVAIPIAKRSTNYGTRASGKADPAKITWRHGLTPGSEFIVYSEQIKVVEISKGLAPVYYHENGVALTAGEREWLFADLKRDANAKSPAPSLVSKPIFTQISDSLDRASKIGRLTDAANANPGKFVDPKLFGL